MEGALSESEGDVYGEAGSAIKMSNNQKFLNSGTGVVDQNIKLKGTPNKQAELNVRAKVDGKQASEESSNKFDALSAVLYLQSEGKLKRSLVAQAFQVALSTHSARRDIKFINRIHAAALRRCN